MENPIPDHVIGIPVNSVSYKIGKEEERPTSVPESDNPYYISSPSKESLKSKQSNSESDNPYYISSPSKESLKSKQNRVETLIDWINKVGKRADSFTRGVYDHVKLGSKVSAIVKRKMRLGARIIKEGGVEKLFKQIFSIGEGENLLNASQCYLSTTAGPIPGLLFISTENIAFCSERSVKVTLPTKEIIRTPYKVMIPLKKIKGANQTENVKNPNQKYIQIVTVDKFEFWFMGFLNYQKAFKYIQRVIYES